ncbi:vWA domain-containing protein [Flexivirga sp. B27]
MTVNEPDEVLLGFTRALRAAGVRVTQDRAATFLAAAAIVGLTDPEAVYVAGRATLCSGPDDLQRYDLVFEAWFGDRSELPRTIPRERKEDVAAPLPVTDEADDAGGEGERDLVNAAASEVEILRHRDVAALDAAQKAILDAMIRALHPRAPQRRAARHAPWRRGQVDLQRTLRSSLRLMGEPGQVRRRRRGTEPRRIILLIDVSASMRPYADALLRLAHTLVHSASPVEAFTLGTRLTRITTALHAADPDRALVRAGDEVPDWAGGTRLGETLEAFLDRWGARGMARGAVVVVFSDGWERGDAQLLGEQMARLGRLAHRVVWVNPHRGKDGYEPVQQGIVAVLPHCDDFVAGHSLRSFEQVLEVVASA